MAAELGCGSSGDGWRARLTLAFARKGGRTVPVQRSHFGPLMVQSPFYPEGAVCHMYLLHPPGGVAGGDLLQLDVVVGEGGEVLLTTPSATKVYRPAGKRSRINQSLRAKSGATIEWLPQETIVFSGADARSATRFELESGARFGVDGPRGPAHVALSKKMIGHRTQTSVIPACQSYRAGPLDGMSGMVGR